MAFDIGPKIGIDGEAEFRSTIAGLNQTMKTLGSEMTLVASQFDKGERSVESLTARNDVLKKQIEAQSSALGSLREALAKASEEYGENDARTQRLQASVNNAAAGLNNLEREFRENSDAAAQMQSDLNGAADKLDSAATAAGTLGNEVEKAEKKSGKFGDVMKGLGKTLASAATAMAAAAAAAAGAVGAMALKAAYAADDLNTLSKQTGISTADLQKFQYAAEIIDVPLETLTGSMSKLTKNMESARQGSKNQAAAFAELGVSITDADGQLRNNQEVFNETIAALGAIENETQRDAYAMQIFGKSAQALNPLILGGADALAELGAEAEAAGLIMSQDALDSANLLSDAMDKFKATTAAAGNAFGASFAAPLTEGLNEVTGYMQRLSKAFSGGGFTALADELGGVISDVISRLTEALPKVIDFGLGIVKNIIDGIQANLPTLVEGAVAVVTTLADALLGMLPQLLDMGVQLVTSLAGGVSDALPALIPAAVAAVVSLTRGLIDSIPQLIKAAIELVRGLAQGVIDAIPELIQALPELIQALVDGLLEAIPEIMQAGIDLLTSIVGALPEIIAAIVEVLPEIIGGIVRSLIESIPLLVQAGIDLLTSLVAALPEIIITVVKALPDLITGIIDALIDNIPLLIQAGVELFVALVSNMPAIIWGIVKAIPEIVIAIVDAIVALVPKLGQAGLDLIKGLWEGISGAADWLWEKISGFFGGVVDKIKDFFGIASPSKLFASLGGNMADGLGVGFGREMKRVSDDMRGAIPTSFDLPQAAMSVPELSPAAYAQSAAAGAMDRDAAIVNAFGTLASGLRSGDASGAPVEVVIKLDGGVELARALLPDIRAVGSQSPAYVG